MPTIAHTNWKGNEEDAKSGVQSLVCCQTHRTRAEKRTPLSASSKVCPSPSYAALVQTILPCFHKCPQLKPPGVPHLLFGAPSKALPCKPA